MYQIAFQTFKIDLRECEEFCIVEDERDDYIVNFNDFANYIAASIDSRKTIAEICPDAFFTEEINVSHKYQYLYPF